MMTAEGPSTAKNTSAMRCSVCGSRFYLEESDAPPFCSERCKLIDLGRWLDEEISVPHEGGPVKGESVEQESDEEQDE